MATEQADRGLLQDAVDADELEALHAQWGNFPVVQVTLAVAPPFLTGENQQLANRGRRAEICYVMQRGAAAVGRGPVAHDHVLLHIKRFYPPEGYRLPTGGVQQGEAVLDTLAREIMEETGQRVAAVGSTCADAVCVERCLGVVVYAMHHTVLGAVRFATYHFGVRMPADGVLAPQDADEQIADWRWLPSTQLPGVAATLDQIGLSHPAWADWGRFRAISHRYVAEWLGTGSLKTDH